MDSSIRFHFEQLDEFREIKCKDRVPENFGYAILFDVDFPSSGNMIASVVGGVVHQISLILDSTMYTVMYDPPLKRDDPFSGLRRNGRVPESMVTTLSFNARTAHKPREESFGAKKIDPELPQAA